MILPMDVRYNINNQVTNSNFETGDLTGWTVTGNAGATTTTPHTGSYCCELQDRFDNIKQDVGLIDNDTFYKVSFWCRFETAELDLQAYVYSSADDTTVLQRVYDVPATLAWYYYEFIFNSNGSTVIELGFTKNGAAAAFLYIDDIRLSRVLGLKRQMEL